MTNKSLATTGGNDKALSFAELMRGLTDEQRSVESLRDIAMLAAAAALGKPPSKDDQEGTLRYNANREHKAAQLLAGMGVNSLMTLKGHLWNMIEEGTWQNVSIPAIDADGKAIVDESGKPELMSFDDMEEWLDAALEGMGENRKPAIRTLLMKVLPLIPADGILAKHQVKGKVIVDGAEVEKVLETVNRKITVEQILDIPDANIEDAAGTLRKLADQVSETDKSPLTKMGIILDRADVLPSKQLRKWLSNFKGSPGTGNGKLPTMEAYVQRNIDDEGATSGGVFCVVCTTGSQIRLLESLLASRTNQIPVSLDQLYQIVSKLGDGSDADASKPDEIVVEAEPEEEERPKRRIPRVGHPLPIEVEEAVKQEANGEDDPF